MAAWSGSTVKVPAWPVPHLAPCASSGRAWRLWAARRFEEEAEPSGAPPLPRVLELAASEAADSTGVDSTALILQELLVDQGSTDNFLTGDVDQLQPTRLAEACAAKGISLNLRMQEGACVSGHVGSSSHCSRCTLGEMPLATRRTDFLTHVRACVGYDHSYFFISTFIEDHVNFHADALAK